MKPILNKLLRKPNSQHRHSSQQILFSIFLLGILLVPRVSNAKNIDEKTVDFFFENERRIALGIITGAGLGYRQDLPAPDYSLATFMASFGYRWSTHHSTRFGIGTDYYINNTVYGKDFWWAAELLYQFHFTPERSKFSPYLLAGLRLPKANVGLGIGNQWYIDETLSFSVEIFGSTLFTADYRGEFRVGLHHHF